MARDKTVTNPEFDEFVDRLAAFQEFLKTAKNSGDAGFACIGLHNPREMRNVGAALRGAGCFGAAMVAVCGAKYEKAATDVKHEYRHIPFLLVDDLRSVIPYSCVPVAVELAPGAKSLVDYEHPRSAFYIFGAENETLGKKTLSWCRDVIYIPTTYSLNLGVCVNVVLYDRLTKLLKRGPMPPRKGRQPPPKGKA